ncbi:MAG: OmpH family outer membrane protein [Deltaproteobacteria bacterium]|nr:OmpH family outer membrane protein [Deltaproteobacteria bacterium]
MMLGSSSVSRLAARVASSLLCLGLLAAPSLASAETKLAVIDLRRALADTEDGLRMKSKLQELMDTRQHEYEVKEKEVAKAKEDLERLAKDGKTAEADLRKRYATLEKQAFDLQNQGLGIRREVTQRENEMMVPILDKLNRIVRQIATQDGYDAVVSRDALPYFRGDLEITDRVIQTYNAANPAPADEKKPAKKDAKATPAAKPEAAAPKAPVAKPAKPKK